MAITHQLRIYFSDSRGAGVQLAPHLADEPCNAVGVAELHLESDQWISLVNFAGTAQVFSAGQGQNMRFYPISIFIRSAARILPHTGIRIFGHEQLSQGGLDRECGVLKRGQRVLEITGGCAGRIDQMGEWSAGIEVSNVFGVADEMGKLMNKGYCSGMRVDREGRVGKMWAVNVETGVEELFCQIDFPVCILWNGEAECSCRAPDQPADCKTIVLRLSE